jgi:protocatechuate 3,4-dioxygenase beta subunit
MLRQYSKPLIIFATISILAVSIFATSMLALSSTVAPSMVDQLQNSLPSDQATPTPSIISTPTPTDTVIESSEPTTTPSNIQTNCNVSGYILDANGNGLAGADIIFGVPDIVPSVHSDNSGYYQIINAPSGTYHLDVWPPFDSSYLSYDEPNFVINTNIAKNITLTLGCKMSGYLTDSSGDPIFGALVSLDNHISGWYSKSDGYYFTTAPAGTYTLKVQPKTGPTFDIYTESGVTINGDISKNIVIPTQSGFKVSGYVKDANGNGIAGAEIIFSVPDLIPSVLTNNVGYFEVYAPAGTYDFCIWPSFDSNFLRYRDRSFTVTGAIHRDFTLTEGCKVSGYLTDSSGNPVFGALVSLDSHISGWYSKSNGYYFVTAPAGTYALTVQPKTGPTFTITTINNFVVNGNIVQNIVVTD